MNIKNALFGLIFLFTLNGNSFSQWSTDPEENTRISNFGLGPFLTTDCKGGAIIAWHSYFYYTDIIVQKVDSAGYVKWAVDGLPICTADLDQGIQDIISDGLGGAFISWTDYRRSVDPALAYHDSADIYLQHINSNGEVQWQQNGILVSNGKDFAPKAKMIADSTGGFIIAWRNEYDYYPITYGVSLNLQRVTAEGEFLWLGDSIKIDYLENERDWAFDMISCGKNGLIISYAEGIFKFNLNGEVLWQITDIPGRLTDYSLVSDGNGGGIFWYTNHDNFNYDLYIQRVNNEGDLMWGENGIFVTTEIPRYFGTSIVPDGMHGAYISWIDSSYTYHYNRIDNSGNLSWNSDNLFFGQLNVKQNLLLTENEEVIVVYRESNASTAGKVQKLGINGIKLWTEEGILFSNLAMANTSCNKISDEDNGIIIVWYERDYEPHYGIFAQKINKYGRLGSITTVKHQVIMQIPVQYYLSQNWPNPFNNQTIIQYTISQKGKVQLTIMNVQGKEVKTLVNKEQSIGSYQIIWNGKDNEGGYISSGIYFYRLKINEFVQTKKLTIIR